MGQVVVVWSDIAKSVFQVHGVDRDGAVVVRRRLRRSRVLPFFATVEPCRIGIEVCATGHYWARELGALGHDVRLMAPSYVKPYVKRQKNDAADAEAICEAVSRPTMRFVPVKTVEQQSVMVLHRTRLLLMRQRTRLANAIRGHMAEYGIVAPSGREGLQRLIEMIGDGRDERVPALARPVCGCCSPSCSWSVRRRWRPIARSKRARGRPRLAAGCGDSWGRPGPGERHRRFGRGSRSVPLREESGCLDRLGAATELEWR
jgi:transposase